MTKVVIWFLKLFVKYLCVDTRSQTNKIETTLLYRSVPVGKIFIIPDKSTARMKKPLEIVKSSRKGILEMIERLGFITAFEANELQPPATEVKWESFDSPQQKVSLMLSEYSIVIFKDGIAKPELIYRQGDGALLSHVFDYITQEFDLPNNQEGTATTKQTK